MVEVALDLKKKLEGSVFSSRLKKDAEQFIRQLSMLLNADFTLYKSLQVISRSRSRVYSRRFRQIITRIIEDVHNGKSFNASTEKFPECFSPIMITLIKIGEESGNLAIVLNELTIYLDRKSKYQKKVKTVLSYPLVVLSISFITVLFLMIFILPAFAEMFAGFGSEIPGLTKALIVISNFIVKYGWLLILLLIFCVWSFKKSLTAHRVEQFFYRFIVNTPIAGNIAIKIKSQFYANIIATLLENGIKMNQVLTQCRDVTENIVLKTLFDQALAKFSEGVTLSEALSVFREFPEDALQIIAIGEESGNLATAFRKIDDTLGKEIEATLDGLTSMLEPIIIIFMALIVGSILIAMYLPIFEISTNLNF